MDLDKKIASWADICECCMAQQKIIELQVRIIENLSKLCIMDRETEDAIQEAMNLRKDKYWEI